MSSCPPRTRASPASKARLSSTLTAGLGSASVPSDHVTSMRPLLPASASTTLHASSTGTMSPYPPAAPKARRKNLSLSALIFALCSSSSKQRLRISGSFSSAISSMPFDIAPTGLSRSWHSREQSRLARSSELLVMGNPFSVPSPLNARQVQVEAPPRHGVAFGRCRMAVRAT